MKEKTGLWMVGVFAMSLFVFAAEVQAQDEAAAQKGQETTEEKPTKIFEPMVRTANISGVCEVNNPDVGIYLKALLNKAYPMGTTYRTGMNGSVVLVFSTDDMISMESNTEVKVTLNPKNPDGRVVELLHGTLKTHMRDNPPEGAMTIITKNASCKNLAGRGEYMLKNENGIETFEVATVTGSVCIEGPQFTVPALRAANTIRIKTAADRSLTRFTSIIGDFDVVLPNGSDKPLTFAMTPMALVKIWRENAPVGGRPLVSVLTMNSKGLSQNRFAYAVGRAELATGELVTEEQKRADEAGLPLKEKDELKPEDKPDQLVVEKFDEPVESK